MEKWLRELQSNKLNAISTNIQILKLPSEQAQLPGLKPKNIGVNSVTKKRDLTNVLPNHSSVLVKTKNANAIMGSYILLKTRKVSKIVCNTTKSTEIKLSLVVKASAPTRFLVIHYQEFVNNAGANHGNHSLQLILVLRETPKSKKNAQLESTSITVDTRMINKQFLTSKE